MIPFKKDSLYLWKTLVSLCSIYIAIFVPLKIVFPLEPNIIVESIYWFASLVFVIDFVINILRKQKGYVSGWLLVDLIAAIPFGLLGGLSYWQLLKLLKLLRIGQYLHQIRKVEIQFSKTLSLVYLFFWTALLAHWLSCGWIALSGIDTSLSVQSNYIGSLYWIITTLTTVGYGDIVPMSDLQRIYSMIVQVSGLVFFGYLIGNVVRLLSNRDPEQTKYLENVENLASVLRSRYIPKDMQNRILDYYGYLKDENMGHDVTSFLESLPSGLRTEVELVFKKELIEKIPLFKNASKDFILECAIKLERIIVPPKECIIKANDVGRDMYFIMSGDLNVINKEGQIISTLSAGDFVGEMALFSDKPRNATVIAVDFCHLYRLAKETFKTIQTKYPEMASLIEKQAKIREAQFS